MTEQIEQIVLRVRESYDRWEDVRHLDGTFAEIRQGHTTHYVQIGEYRHRFEHDHDARLIDGVPVRIFAPKGWGRSTN